MAAEIVCTGSPRQERSDQIYENNVLQYSGWVYHLGINSIGHEYCHLRFLFLRGTRVFMYKRDPHENSGIKPIRKGVISHTLMVEELGRRKINHGDLFVLKFYNRLDETKKGEIACASVGDARKWMEAFDQAKQQAEYELFHGNGEQMLNVMTELNLEGHRSHVRRHAHGLKKFIRIGKGPERLLHHSSDVGDSERHDYERNTSDAFEEHEWKCVRAVRGIRIFQDMASLKNSKRLLVKSVGVVDASADTIFEVVLSLDKRKRYEWDMLTGDLELLDAISGHHDIVYGTYDPNNLARIFRWRSKKEFIFSRQWFRGQDGAYTILQFPAVHKRRPHRPGFRHAKINPSMWEIRDLASSSNLSAEKCIVTHMLEIKSSGWGPWKERNFKDFEQTIAYILLSQVAGLREYFDAHPLIMCESPSVIETNSSLPSISSSGEFDDSNLKEEFFDAIAADKLLEDDDSDDEVELSKNGKLTLKNVSWAIASLNLMRSPAVALASELDTSISPVIIDLNQFRGTLSRGCTDSERNCWSSPHGQGFKIRGPSYLKDFSKVISGDPLLTLLAVDWFMSDTRIDMVAMDPKCIIQSDAGKALPFILVVNLQVPANPNYSLILYYGADRPIHRGSLLSKFVNGTDAFRNSRFKLIPNIVEGYWMVKKAVGSKACLLGKAVSCRYLRVGNILEIDVDIGSSSVARSIISLVLGYVTSIVIDLAILIEGNLEAELPEYILATVRLNCMRLDSAVQH